jgi:hypothetical protein
MTAAFAVPPDANGVLNGKSRSFREKDCEHHAYPIEAPRSGCGRQSEIARLRRKGEAGGELLSKWEAWQVFEVPPEYLSRVGGFNHFFVSQTYGASV